MALLQRGKAGAGTMGRHFDANAPAFVVESDYPLFIGEFAGFQANTGKALLLKQALDQSRPQARADGVGTLDAQHAIVCRQVGPGLPGQQVTEKGDQQGAGGQPPGIADVSGRVAGHGTGTLWQECAATIRQKSD